MREPFAHDAVLSMPAGADMDAPGAAVTVALCGHWDHEPPCPLAAHHIGAQRRGDDLCLRILFATEPDDEPEVRARITAALSSQWTVRSSAAGAVTAGETDHAARLMRS